MEAQGGPVRLMSLRNEGNRRRAGPYLMSFFAAFSNPGSAPSIVLVSTQ